MSLWRKLRYLSPSRRAAEEREMREEFESLAAIAEPRELGNLTRVAEDARAVWGWTLLEQILHDVQYALRTMRQKNGFTATAVLSLALGIGANTAIFSLIDALMLRWLPVRDPQELVQLRQRATREKRPSENFSYPIATALAKEKEIFSNLTGFGTTNFNVGPKGSVTRIPGAWVTGGFYETLGLRPAAGRLLVSSDDEPGAQMVAVISHGYWERQYSRNPGVVGQSIFVNGIPATIAGVSPEGFTGATVGLIADITLPVAALPRSSPEVAGLVGPGNFWLHILARPAEGVSPEQAQARLAIVWPAISERVIRPDWPLARRKAMAAAIFELVPGATGYTFLRDMFRKPLFVLMAVVALVLLIACANVANLLLARAAARQREISTRLAIGAGRARIVRQLLTESALLSLTGAALGVLLAWLASTRLLNVLAAGSIPLAFDLTPNWRVLAFTAAVALSTGILFGLAPAFQSTSAGPSAGLKEDARMTRSRSRLLSSLVTVQVALSLMLLVGAGLFVRTLQNLASVDPGFHTEGVLVIPIDGRPEGYREAGLVAFYKDLLERMQGIPGVTSVSISGNTPLSGATWTESVMPKGRPLPENENSRFVAVGPRYFETLGTPLISGREFDSRDEGSTNVAIVNQAFAARYLAGKNPVGEFLTATVTRPPSDFQIVGVVKDTVAESLRGAPPPIVYVPYFRGFSSLATALEIHAAGSLTQISGAIRRELHPRLPSAPLEIRTLSERVAGSIVQERLMAGLAGAFGALGLVLACVGLYGLLAYSIARRTKEMGIRIALGAQPRGVLAMVVRGALRLVIWGVVLGLPAAWAASRAIASMLFGLKPDDPSILTTAVVLLIASALLAALIPAHRASRVDPITALRHE